MPRELLLYLEDIRDAVASIRSYMGDRTFEKFVGDRMCLDAVVPPVHHYRGGDEADSPERHRPLPGDRVAEDCRAPGHQRSLLLCRETDNPLGHHPDQTRAPGGRGRGG